MSVEDGAYDDTLAVDGAVAAPLLTPGTVFAERYLVEALLGKGGMGAVYRVRDQHLDEVVALKVMTMSERIVEEVKLARRVTHPNVARTHDIGIHGGARYLTMECVHGTVLADEIAARAPLAAERVVAIGLDVAKGLAAAHAANIIHRDLKPANIMLAEDRAIITDFGIALPLSESTSDIPLVGTPLYMSPEQALGEGIDARTDLYALGLIMYEMATGVHPFDAPTHRETMAARIRRPPEHPREKVADLPLALAELTMWLLALDPEERPATADAVAEALQAQQRATQTPFAPVSPGERSLAVLPFRFRGPSAESYLGDGVAEELIDTLSRTQGLKVFAFGATERFRDQRDPAAVADALGADHVVDGSLHRVGERLVTKVRMLDRDGLQLWSDRFDATGDVLALLETLGMRLAEALRLKLDAGAKGAGVEPEALHFYMRARRAHRIDFTMGETSVLEDLERSLELAPRFAAAIAAHAMACVRASWGGSAEHIEAAERSVLRAEEEAGHLAETHIARANLSSHRGAYRTCAAALQRALAIAPTCVEGHVLLGQLEAEAGREEEGFERLMLALELDSGLAVAKLLLARLHRYRGDDASAATMIDELAALTGDHAQPVLGARARSALEHGDRDEALRHFALLDQIESPSQKLVSPVVRVLEGTGEPADAVAEVIAVAHHVHNRRFRLLLGQIGVEILAFAEHPEPALDLLSWLAEDMLIDIVWLERSTLFAPLRSHPRFAAACARVRHRATAIWSRLPRA